MYPMNYPYGMANAFGQDNMGPLQRLIGRFHPQTGGGLPPVQQSVHTGGFDAPMGFPRAHTGGGYNPMQQPYGQIANGGGLPPMAYPQVHTGGGYQPMRAFPFGQRRQGGYGPHGPGMGGI